MADAQNTGPKRQAWLRNAIAGETRLCKLDEKKHELRYCGYRIEDLAARSTYDEVAYLLLCGELPRSDEFQCLRTDLRTSAEKIVSVGQGALWHIPYDYARAHPMDILALMMRVDGNLAPNDARSATAENDYRLARYLIGRTAVFCGLMARATESRYQHLWQYRIPFTGSPAKNFFVARTWRSADEFEARLMDIAMILYAEHEINAGTFAVRVAASAHTDIYSAIMAGISTLRGTRHGGANEEAMKMMIEIGAPENVRAYCDRFFETSGARLPGFGHAVYTLRDPRTAILRPLVRELSQRKQDTRWYEMCLALEEYMAERSAEKEKNVPANVDLWTAPLYYLLGIPIPLYTPLFAAARVAGWCAHYLEVRHIFREPILRPRAKYSGPRKPRRYVPIEQRASTPP